VAKKKPSLGILVMALVFGITVAGCNNPDGSVNDIWSDVVEWYTN